MTDYPWLEELSRRSFLERAGRLGVVAALSPLPSIVSANGVRSTPGTAVPADVVRDTLSGVLAFMLPGDDAYSLAQGESAHGPGSIGAGTLEPFITVLDNYVPASLLGVKDVTVPGSAVVTWFLNEIALQVNPLAAHGRFLSPFARLSFREKGEVFRRFEGERTISNLEPELKFVAGILPASAAFMSFSEAGVYDPKTRRLRSEPLGSRISGYGGSAEGHAEFKGYFQGRRSAVGGRG
jgi:hypothetical protein